MMKKMNNNLKIYNMKNIKGIILAIVLALTVSCGEDFLQEEPLSFLSPENTFIDAGGLQTALEPCLVRVFDQWHRDYAEINFNNGMSDMMVLGATDKQASMVNLRQYMNPSNDINNTGSRTLEFYEENYLGLKSANTVIDLIDTPEWEGGDADEERNHLLGSAYFMRAFFYYQLTLQFGNVAFPLNIVTESRQDFKAFGMQGIWDQMISDLEYAIQHMKPKSELPGGQAPLDAARMLLAKYYMMNLKFAEAEAMIDLVISDGESKLFEAGDVSVSTVLVGGNYNAFGTGELIPGWDCEQPADPINALHEASQRVTNPEGIWLSTNAPFLEGSRRRTARIRGYAPNLWSTNKGVKAPQTGARTALHISQNDKTKQMHKWGRGQGFFRPTNYSQYGVWMFGGSNDTQDYRHKRGNWYDMDMAVYDNPDLKDDPIFHQPLQLWSDDGTVLLCEDSIRCWYGFPMYKFWTPNVEDAVKRQDGGKGTLYIYRMAHAYLIRAEARFWQDDHQGCADDINIIRGRANAQVMYTAADVTAAGIGAVLDERVRELYGEEYRHDELVRISVVLAKSGKTCYNGKTYSAGSDIETSLSASSFYFDRVMEKNDFFREGTAWATYPDVVYTMDPMHIFWPVYEPFLVGNVGAKLNQTTGYDGSESNIAPLVHVVQPAGKPNTDPQKAIGDL
jgi:hypothetical protein